MKGLLKKIWGIVSPAYRVAQRSEMTMNQHFERNFKEMKRVINKIDIIHKKINRLDDIQCDSLNEINRINSVIAKLDNIAEKQKELKAAQDSISTELKKLSLINKSIEKFDNDFKKISIENAEIQNDIDRTRTVVDMLGNKMLVHGDLIVNLHDSLSAKIDDCYEDIKEIGFQNEKKMTDHEGLFSRIYSDLSSKLDQSQNAVNSIETSLCEIKETTENSELDLSLVREITIDSWEYKNFLNHFSLEEDKVHQHVLVEDLNIELRDVFSFFVVYKEVFLYEDYFIDFKKNDPVILDCGAHIGLASLYFKKKYPDSRITCFEPDPTNYQILLNNIEKNDLSGIEVINKAVSNKEDEITFYSVNDMSMGGSIFERINKEKHDVVSTKVKSCSIKNYIKAEKVDFLKLDIEGPEDLVIDDIKEVIGNVNYLFIEFHTGADLDVSRLTKILQVLDENNFTYHISKSDSYALTTKSKPLSKLKQLCTQLIYAKNQAWED